MNYLVFVCLCFPLLLIAQDSKSDSLEKVLKTQKEDSNKVRTLDALCVELNKRDPDKALDYGNRALELAVRIGFRKGAATSLNNIGQVYMFLGNYPEAEKYFLQAIDSAKKTGDEGAEGNAYNSLGITRWYQGNYAPALEFLMKALKIREKGGNKGFIAATLNNIGMIYKEQGNFKSALDYYLLALSQIDTVQNKRGYGGTLDNIGIVYRNMGELDKAIAFHQKALKIKREANDKKGVAISLNNLGTAFIRQKKYAEGLKNFFSSLELKKELKDKTGQATTLNNIAAAYLELNDLPKALDYVEQSKVLCLETGYKECLKENYLLLAQINAGLKNYKEAYNNYRLYTEVKDTILNEKNQKSIAQMQTIYESEKKDKEIQLLNKDKVMQEEISKADSRRKNFIIWSVVAGLVLVIVFSSFLFNRFQITQKQKKIIEEQKSVVEEKNKDITDSINYAKRIQDAILPGEALKHKLFRDIFILFQPRDIVSGDFYWFAEKDGKKVIAAVDCTGHGVPGAFMSMIGNAFLNEIVNQRGITRPGDILSELRFLVINALKQTGAEGETRDGMDMALLSFDEANATVEFAGANNPLWIMKTTGPGLTEIRGDKRPIGFFKGQGLPFTTQKVAYSKGDTFYIFTDGFADQFGGPKGKKFKYRQLQDLLLSMKDKSMQEQEKLLLDTFKKWKGNLEQVDDVCVIGVRV